MPSLSATVTTVEVDVDFEVFCGKCGAGQCGDSETGNTSRRKTPYVRVTPCAACMENEYERGREAGYNEATKERDV
jgi:hypothetical protein